MSQSADQRIPQRLWVQIDGRRCWGICVPLHVSGGQTWELRVWGQRAAYYSVFDDDPWEALPNLLGDDWEQVGFVDRDYGWRDRSREELAHG